MRHQESVDVRLQWKKFYQIVAKKWNVNVKLKVLQTVYLMNGLANFEENTVCIWPVAGFCSGFQGLAVKSRP